MKWDVMESLGPTLVIIDLIKNNELEADVPQYLFPALCLASKMMMRDAKEPKGMIEFFEECKAQIESSFGEGTDNFFLIPDERDTAFGMPAPPMEGIATDQDSAPLRRRGGVHPLDLGNSCEHLLIYQTDG